MAKEIKFNIKLNVDGKEQLVTATTGIKEISEAANACRSRLGEMNNVLVHFNQKIEKYRNIADSISQLPSFPSPRLHGPAVNGRDAAHGRDG